MDVVFYEVMTRLYLWLLEGYLHDVLIQRNDQENEKRESSTEAPVEVVEGNEQKSSAV
jgi:hypothetical protein